MQKDLLLGNTFQNRSPFPTLKQYHGLGQGHEPGESSIGWIIGSKAWQLCAVQKLTMLVVTQVRSCHIHTQNPDGLLAHLKKKSVFTMVCQTLYRLALLHHFSGLIVYSSSHACSTIRMFALVVPFPWKSLTSICHPSSYWFYSTSSDHNI